MSNLYDNAIEQNYRGIINMQTINGPISASRQYLTDGAGNNLPFQVSTTELNVVKTLSLANAGNTFGVSFDASAIASSNKTLTIQNLSGTIPIDSLVTHLAGAEVITGIKTFSVRQIISASIGASADYGTLSIGNGGFAGGAGNFAGSASGTWLAFNVSSSSPDFFNFQVSGAQRASLSCAGNFRIGTNTGTNALLTVGTGAGTGGSFGAATSYTIDIQSTTISGAGAGIGAVVNNGSTNYRTSISIDQTSGLAVWSSTYSSGPLPMVIRNAGVEVMRLFETGNVIVGATSTPVARYQIRAASVLTGLVVESAAGGATSVAQALVNFYSTTQGILLPSMTATQKNAISTPPTGLIVFQTDGTPGIYYYSGAWIQASPDTLVVHLAGTETITGAKTFTNNIVFSANVGIGNTPTRLLAVGAGVGTSGNFGAGATSYTIEIQSTTVAGNGAGVGAIVQNGSTNYRTAISIDQTNALAVWSSTYTSGPLPMVIKNVGVECARFLESGYAGFGGGTPLSSMESAGSTGLKTTETTSTTVTLDGTTTLWAFTGSSACALTLVGRAANLNRLYILANEGTAVVTVSRAGSDNISIQGLSVTSFNIYPGETYFIQATATYWRVTSMDVPIQQIQATAANANTTFVIPKGYIIDAVGVENTTGSGVTDGFNIGTTGGDDDVLSAQPCAASATITPIAIMPNFLKTYFSKTLDQTLYISAVSTWGGANLNFTIWIRRYF